MTSPGAPSHHHRVKKLDFHWSVVQNRGSTFSRRGVPGSGFEDKNGAKMDLQIMINVVKNEPRKSIRNSIPKVSQKGATRNPKWSQNCIQNLFHFLLILIDFWVPPGCPPGSNSLGSAAERAAPISSIYH